LERVWFAITAAVLKVDLRKKMKLLIDPEDPYWSEKPVDRFRSFNQDTT
jgi:hypothetical protein